MISPGSTIGFSELASSLMFSTSTPCSWATLFRLKSLVMILPRTAWPARSASGRLRGPRENRLRRSEYSGWQFSAGAAGCRGRGGRGCVHGVGGIGDQLQLAQDELRGHDDAVQEAGLGDVGDAAVDDDAGVENLIDALALLLAAEDAAQRRQVEQVALVGADDQADVSHQQHDQYLQETLSRPGAMLLRMTR